MNRIISIENLPNIIDTRRIVEVGKGHVTMRSLNYAINKYETEKKIVRVKRGIYSKTGNPFYVAAEIYNGYVGFSSALYIYRLKTEIERDISVCVDKPKKQIRFLDKILSPVNMGGYSYGGTFIKFEGLEVYTSTYSKTFFDMLLKPGHANYFDFYRALHSRHLTHKEWNELYYYLTKSNLTTVRRAGYMLEDEAPNYFISRLKRISDSGSRSSFFFKHRMLNYSKTWNIFDDLGVKRWKNAE